MRDESRIKKILKILEKMWKQNPDQRFCQMLINYGIVKDDIQTWTLEDDELLEGLEKWEQQNIKKQKDKQRK